MEEQQSFSLMDLFVDHLELISPHLLPENHADINCLNELFCVAPYLREVYKKYLKYLRKTLDQRLFISSQLELPEGELNVCKLLKKMVLADSDRSLSKSDIVVGVWILARHGSHRALASRFKNPSYCRFLHRH